MPDISSQIVGSLLSPYVSPAQKAMPFPDNHNPEQDFNSRFGNLPPAGILNDLKKPADTSPALVRKINDVTVAYPNNKYTKDLMNPFDFGRGVGRGEETGGGPASHLPEGLEINPGSRGYQINKPGDPNPMGTGQSPAHAREDFYRWNQHLEPPQTYNPETWDMLNGSPISMRPGATVRALRGPPTMPNDNMDMDPEINDFHTQDKNVVPPATLLQLLKAAPGTNA